MHFNVKIFVFNEINVTHDITIQIFVNQQTAQLFNSLGF